MKKASVASLTVFLLIFSALQIFPQNMFRKASDFDGDGRADFAITRNVGGLKYWWIWQTTGGLKVLQWGLNFDLTAAGDYDGDGKTDMAVYRRPSTSPLVFTYYILESQTNTFTYTTFTDFGYFGERLAHQDYNGDGRTDPGVNLGEFGLFTVTKVRYSGSDSGFSVLVPAGGAPIRIGDMDGGGSADLAHYTFNGNVVTIRSTETDATSSVQFGAFNDRYQMADFDGDGKGDLTLWRSSTGEWMWIGSSDNTMQTARWGVSGDLAVPADYDGDGRTDLAIWRGGAQSHYWINGSQNGVFVVPWGTAGDSPVAY